MLMKAFNLSMKIQGNNEFIFIIPEKVQFVAVVKQNLPCFPYPNIHLLFLEGQIPVLVHQQLGDTRS